MIRLNEKKLRNRRAIKCIASSLHDKSPSPITSSKTYTQTDTHPITSGFVTLHLIMIQFCWFCLRSGICLVVLNNQLSYLSFFPYCCYKHRVLLFTRPRVFLSSTTVTFNSQLLWFSFSLYFFSPLYFLHRSPVFFFLLFACAHIYIKKNHYRVLFFSYCLPLINNKPVTTSPWEPFVWSLLTVSCVQLVFRLYLSKVLILFYFKFYCHHAECF